MIRLHVPVDSDANHSKVNPGTVDKIKLMAYYNIGINRLSIGLQSTDDQELKMLGRILYIRISWIHIPSREAGFRNINVNLMSESHFRHWEDGKIRSKSCRTCAGTYLGIQSDYRRGNTIL